MKTRIFFKAALLSIAAIISFSACIPGIGKDDKVIVNDPQEFLLEPEELPLEGNYYLPDATWMTLLGNDKVLLDQGVKEGKEYVTETGRVVGWTKNYLRNNLSAQLPDEIDQGIYMFKTADGAQLALTKYTDDMNKDPADGWETIDADLDWKNKADAVLVQKHQKIRTDGAKQTWYDINFAFRNFVVSVEGHADFEADVDPELISDLAEKILEKLDEAPLVKPEEAESTFNLYENM